MKKILFFLLLMIPFLVSAEAAGTDYCFNWTLDDEGTLTYSTEYEDCYYFPENYERPWRAQYASQIKKIVFENGIDVIVRHSFENLPELEEVVFPKSMGGQIADYAFYNCPNLKNITIPFGISRIGDYAFYGTGITKVELPVFVSWLGTNAFPDGTTITRPAEYDELIAAGTAGPLHSLKDGSGTLNAQGIASEDTCYIHILFDQFYDDTAYWKLYKDGTLIIYGQQITSGYSASRNPWGCYKKQIKKMIFNYDKIGTITKQNKLDPDEKLPNAVYAVYATKPVEEIMNNRIKVLRGNYFWDCREECRQSSYDIDTVIVNRGVEFIDEAFYVNEEPLGERDIYINKYVKTFYETSLLSTGPFAPLWNHLHIGVSPDDYFNNEYEYTLVSSYSSGEVVVEDGKFVFKSNSNMPPELIDVYYRGDLINDIDEYYVSINDNTAPKEIEVDGKTLYLYETYKTGADGSADISIPADQEDVEFYVKEIVAPEGFELDPDVYEIDMTGKVLGVIVADYPIDYTSSEELENPETRDGIFIFIIILSISLPLIIYSNKKREWNR